LDAVFPVRCAPPTRQGIAWSSFTPSPKVKEQPKNSAHPRRRESSAGGEILKPSGPMVYVTSYTTVSLYVRFDLPTIPFLGTPPRSGSFSQ
jgi:hypothetical protein